MLTSHHCGMRGPGQEPTGATAALYHPHHDVEASPGYFEILELQPTIFAN